MATSLPIENHNKVQQSEDVVNVCDDKICNVDKHEDTSENRVYKKSSRKKHLKARKPIKLSNIYINRHCSLVLPAQYQGSKMFMPTGERLFWQAEVLPPPQGPAMCQDFNEIRSRCLSEGVLFKDPEFPASGSSLMSKLHEFEQRFEEPIKWLRPGDIVDNPQFCVKGYRRFDVNQGCVGNCWFTAALTNLTIWKKLFNQVVPYDQGFEEEYAGIFHFRFWQYGRWVDVVIDDRLPTSSGKLIFLQSSEKREFWSALLEKAYAKLYGSYGAIKRGPPSEAMEDFTGGFVERYRVSNLPGDFFSVLLKAYERSSLINASTDTSQFMRCGLRGNHAYSITSVKCIDSDIRLLRLRNPWGKTEWEGPWSDKSSEWSSIPLEKKDSLGLEVRIDGEFWMTYNDFVKHFSILYICNLNPESFYSVDYPDDCELKWEMSMFEGKWLKGETSGGSCMDSESYQNNPQYTITLNDNNKCDVASKDNIVIISLMQKYTRKHDGQKYLGIGFRLFQVDNEKEDDFKAKHIEIPYPRYAKSRVFSARLSLKPGKYRIVPHTAESDEEGEFLLRVLTEKVATRKAIAEKSC